MKIAIRYYSKTGNSQKLADAMAEVLHVTAKPVSVPLDDPVDILVLCNSLYYAEVDKHVFQFIEDNASKMRKLVNVSNGAVFESSYDQIKEACEKAGVEIAREEFHCVGQSDVSNIGHPDVQDLNDVKAFIKDVSHKYEE